MKKHFSKIVGLSLGIAMAIGVGVGVTIASKNAAPVFAEAVGGTDTINSSKLDLSSTGSSAWATGNIGSNTSGAVYSYRFMGTKNTTDDRIAGTNANGGIWTTSSGGVLNSVTVTTVTSKALALYGSTSAFSGYSDTSDKTSLGTGTTTGSGSTYSYTWSNLSSNNCAHVLLKGTASSTFIKSIVFVWDAPSADPEIALNKTTITVSKGEDARFIVTTANLTSNFSVTGGDDSYFTTSYSASSADDDHVVTLHGVEVTSSPITLTVSATGAASKTIAVSVVEAVYYEKVTAGSDIKSGREIIIGTTDGTAVLGKYSSGNNCPALDNVPNAGGKLIESELPDDVAILTIGGSSNSWNLTDQNSNIYFGVSGSNNLKANNSATDTWSISISAAGVATVTSAASSRIIKKNTSDPLFNTYQSGQTDISVYMIPTVEKEIQVTVTGSQSLGVGETAKLTVNKLNGATGTVNWATSNASALSLSASTGDEVTVTAGSVLGDATITASLAGCEDVVTSFVIRKGSLSQPYTVAEARTAIDGSDSGAKTNVYVSGIVSQVDSLNSDNSITYWISDDGTVTDHLEVYKGKGLDSANFSSKDDVEVGANVVVFGNLTKYSSTYEFASGNKLITYEAPSGDATINTLLENASTVATIHGVETRTSDVLPENIVFADEGLDNGVEYTDPFNIGSHSTIQFSSGCKYYDGGTGMRVYGGGSFVIESAEDISKIVFSWDGSNKPADDDVADSGEYNVSTFTWTGNANSITFTRPSGSGHWRLKTVEVTYGAFASVGNIALRFGVSIPASSWNGINGIEDTEITDYGVMFLKEATLNGYGKTSVEAAFKADMAVTIKHKGSGAAPYLDGSNYLFTIKVSIPATYYGDVICAVPFIKVNDTYYFMEEKHESVNSLATYYRANGGSDLSNDALDYLKTAN